MESITINMTEEVNKAIIKVITHQYKKDCPEAHKLVQDWGYTIEKKNGSFRVKNENTNKEVYFENDIYYDSPYGVIYVHHKRIALKKKDQINKINFVKYLNTPLNSYLWDENGYRSVYQYTRYHSDAVDKYKKLKMAKHNAKYCRKAIIEENEKLQKVLEDHRRWIEYYTQQSKIHDEEIEELRKEYGLTK